MKTKRISLKDVALAAGVSKATVSLVLNGKGDELNISKECQERIKMKAHELNYVPNLFAKNLRDGGTKTIGVIIPDVSNSFYACLTKEIQKSLNEAGYSAFIVNTNEEEGQEQEIVNELLHHSVEGLIICPTNDTSVLLQLTKDSNIPIVFADRYGDETADFVGIDNFTEASNLVSCFTQKPQAIAVLLRKNSYVNTLGRRIHGVTHACKQQGISSKIIELSPMSNDENFIQIKEAIDSGVDAFIALNNLVVLDFLSVLKQLNKKIGIDIRLICFDDHSAFPYIEPPISSLRQPISEIGRHVVDRMIKRIKQDETPGEHNFRKCEFIPRASH